MQFAVWAPDAKTLEVEVDGRRSAMQRGEDQWWTVEVEGVSAGTDYSFSIDGGDLLPDPRSAWQPHGVQGPSRVVDHHAFPWTDHEFQAKPLSAAVIYEVHIGTFTPEGTFEAAIERLDHLKQLGVTHVELMPVIEAPGSYGWGYDGVDLFAPHHAMGGPMGLKRLVDACHARGLAVILDVVYNHLGPSGNYLPRFGPYFTERYATPWGWAVNLDQAGSDEVRRYFCDNALMWLRDYHFDGLRFDAVHALIDASAVHLLEQLALEVDDLGAQLGRHLVLIAESDLNNPRVVQSREIGGYGMDAQWSDDFHHALHVMLTGEASGYYADFGSLGHLAKALKQAYIYDGCHSACRGRKHGRPARGLCGYNFLGYLQTHDQVGNRAQGERIGHLISPERLKIGVAMLFVAPFVPMLFQGEEWNATSPFQYFTNFDDAELGNAVCEGRRHEFAAFGWDPESIPDPQAPETFLRSKLDWSELERGPHAEMLDWYRQMIRLRRSLGVLSDGRMERVNTRCDEKAGWFVLERGPVTLAFNLAEHEQDVPFDETRPSELLAALREGTAVGGGALRLPAESVAIVGPPVRSWAHSPAPIAGPHVQNGRGQRRSRQPNATSAAAARLAN